MLKDRYINCTYFSCRYSIRSGFGIRYSWSQSGNQPLTKTGKDSKMEKSFLNSIPQGEKLRLRDDVFPLVEKREWIFAGIGKSDTTSLSQNNDNDLRS